MTQHFTVLTFVLLFIGLLIVIYTYLSSSSSVLSPVYEQEYTDVYAYEPFVEPRGGNPAMLSADPNGPLEPSKRVILGRMVTDSRLLKPNQKFQNLKSLDPNRFTPPPHRFKVTGAPVENTSSTSSSTKRPNTSTTLKTLPSANSFMRNLATVTQPKLVTTTKKPTRTLLKTLAGPTRKLSTTKTLLKTKKPSITKRRLSSYPTPLKTSAPQSLPKRPVTPRMTVKTKDALKANRVTQAFKKQSTIPGQWKPPSTPKINTKRLVSASAPKTVMTTKKMAKTIPKNKKR